MTDDTLVPTDLPSGLVEVGRRMEDGTLVIEAEVADASPPHLASVSLGHGRSIHIATLSQETIKASAADHLGFGGYFLFETGDAGITEGINVLGKASSLDAAFRLIDIWNTKPQMAYGAKS